MKGWDISGVKVWAPSGEGEENTEIDIGDGGGNGGSGFRNSRYIAYICILNKKVKQ